MRKNIFIIGIAGGSGSGKTTFAQKILTLLNISHAIHLHQDAYYLAIHPKEFNIKEKPNFDHPAVFDWQLIRQQLSELRAGNSISSPVYDFIKSHRLSETVTVGPSQVCLFDGIYTLFDFEVRSMLDLKIFLDVDADIRFIRRLHRDVKERGRTLDSVISQYYDTVRPMHRQFLEPTKQFADLIVGEENDCAATVIASRIKAIIQGDRT